jgi:dethiobiotin synthetase
MAKGFFITGTDTGVGKTVVTAALIMSVKILGRRACVMKPIETGCLKKGDVLIPSDGMFLRELAGMDDSMDLVATVRFANPLAPMPAAEIEGKPIDLNKIREAFTELSKNYDALIVEGIGGLLVPIKRNYFLLDLARDFGLPLIVVSRPGLGTINHTLLTVNCAIKEGLTVAGIIINYSMPPEGNLAEKTNPEVIRQVGPVPIIGIFPYLGVLENSTIERAAANNLNFAIIKKYL